MSYKSMSTHMKHTLYPCLHHRGLKAGFTLVEMLAVVGIILILMTLTIYGIRGTGGATNRRAAVGALMGVFDQARMVAISDGRPTYVVFASEPKGQTQDPTALAAVPDSLWGRAYALFEDPQISDSMTSAAAVQRSNWLYLPTGVSFKCEGSTDSSHDSVTAHARLSTDPSSDQTKFNVVTRTGTPSTLAGVILPYIKFDAMGQIVDQNGNMVDAASPCLRVLLFEGVVQGAANNASVEIYTHRSAINATDGNQYALDEILLKPTTGRAEYTLDPSRNLAAVTTTP